MMHIDLAVVNLKKYYTNSSMENRLILGILYGIFMGDKISYYRMATIAMLFATVELMFAVAMHGYPQLGMFAMAGASSFIAFVAYSLHYNQARYNYIADKETYV